MFERDAIHSRGKALEDEFFRRVDQKLMEDMRRSAERKATREQLAKVTGLKDETVLDHMVDAGFEPTTLTAWGTDPDTTPPLTASTSALVPSDSMHVRLFHPSTDAEYSAPDSRITVSFRSGPPPLISQARYVPEGIYVLERVHIQRTLVTQQE